MKPTVYTIPPGPKAKKILKLDNKFISPSLTRGYPLVIKRSYDVNIEDVDGNVYLDFSSLLGVMNIGHSNSKVIKTINKQIKKSFYSGFSDFYSKSPIDFAQSLVSLLPKGLDKIFFCNSGAESIETAIKLVRYYTKRKYFLAFYRAYHGTTTIGAFSLTDIPNKNRFGKFLSVIRTPYPYCYRCYFNKRYPSCSLECIEYIKYKIFKKISPDKIGAVFIEPILGSEIVIPPKEFHIELKKLCEKYGILYVADEVFTGNFRTGSFLATQCFGIIPDIICLSKGIGGGLPIGITIANKKIMSWDKCCHISTFGGNPLICAVGLTVLNIFKQNKISDKVKENGNYIMRFLSRLRTKYNIIGDIRGKGLMIGVELVKDRRKKLPAVEEKNKILYIAFQKGLILHGGYSTIKILPPLIIKKKDIDVGLNILEEAIKTVCI